MCSKKEVVVRGVKIEMSLSPEEIKKLPKSDQKIIASFIIQCVEHAKSLKPHSHP